MIIMGDHFNTASGWPQTQAEVEAMDASGLDQFMALCDVEPADKDVCLACYAYWVALEREANAKEEREADERERRATEAYVEISSDLNAKANGAVTLSQIQWVLSQTLAHPRRHDLLRES